MSEVQSDYIEEGGRVIEHHKEGNLEQLTRKILEEREKLDDYIERVDQEVLLNKNTDNKVALSELSSLKKLFDKSMDKINTFRNYE